VRARVTGGRRGGGGAWTKAADLAHSEENPTGRGSEDCSIVTTARVSCSQGSRIGPSGVTLRKRVRAVPILIKMTLLN
jgi:hypothetical protein